MYSVYYSGNLKHNVTDQHARPIRFIQRESLKEALKTEQNHQNI